MNDETTLSIAEDDQNKFDLSERFDQIYTGFLVLLTGACIYGAVTYWAMIMGMTHDGVLRFDIAPNHWRIISSGLALLLPLTALGIWFRTAFGLWGWLLFTMIQIFMHGLLPDLYGHNFAQLFVICLLALIFVGFKLAFIKRRRAHHAES